MANRKMKINQNNLPVPDKDGMPEVLPLPAMAARAARFCMFMALMSEKVTLLGLFGC